MRSPPWHGVRPAVACVFLVAVAQSVQTSLSDRVTLAYGDNAGGCILLADSVARTRPPVTILWPPADQVGGTDAQIVRARVGAKRANCASPDSGYAIEGAVLAAHTPYVAVLGSTGPARVRRDRIEIDLTGDGKPESVRVCTSTEGVHFTVWSGVPFRSRRLAHLYAPLNYDVEPSCRRAEYEE